MSIFKSKDKHRKLSQQESECDQISVYYRSDYKWCVRVSFTRGTQIVDILEELIKQLKLNGMFVILYLDKLDYQILLLTHCSKVPAEGYVIVKRRLRQDDQPYKIIQLHHKYKLSLYIDYAYNQLNNANTEKLVILDDISRGYDKEFKILKATFEGDHKAIALRINSQGISLHQQGSKKWINSLHTLNAEQNLSKILFSQFQQTIRLIFSKQPTKMIFAKCNNISQNSHKLIHKYTKNTEVVHSMINYDKQIQGITQSLLNQLESSCYMCIKSKQQLHAYPEYNSFAEVLKLTQLLKDTSDIESEDMKIDITPYQPFILETLSILPREQYRNQLVKFNSWYTYTASCKIEDQLEECEQLCQSLDEVLVSQEQIEKYSQFLQ